MDLIPIKIHICIQKYLIQYISEKSKPLESFHRCIKHLGTQEDPDIMLIISNAKVFTHTLESSLDETKEQGVNYPLQPSQQAIGAFPGSSPHSISSATC